MTDAARLGVGIDIVSVNRINEILKRWGRRFLKRIYTQAEIDYCLRRSSPSRSLAARFAAKEAFLKAVYPQSKGGIPYRDIEIMVTKGGMPVVKAHGKAQRDTGNLQVCLSMSHEQDLAVAIVVTSPGVKP